MAETEEKKVAAKKPAAKKAPAKKPAAPKAETEAKETKKAAKAEAKAVKEEAKAAKKAEKAAKKAPKEVKPEVVHDSARCYVRDVRVTPRKVRYVADYVRGKDVAEALAILKNVNKVAALPVAKAIASAAANATNNFGMEKDKLYVAEIQVGDGLRIKRYIPRAKGSASGIIKRNSHLTVVVKERK